MSQIALDNSFLIEMDTEHFQPVLIHKLFGTSYFLTGRFFTKTIKKQKYLDKIHMKYNRVFGLVNFKIEKLIVERKQDDIIGKEIIFINVYYRAFQKPQKGTYFNYEIKNPIKIENDEYIHVKPIEASSEIKDLDIKDDITYLYDDEVTNDVPCRSKIKNEGP